MGAAEGGSFTGDAWKGSQVLQWRNDGMAE
jgi:hypothetical protein